MFCKLLHIFDQHQSRETAKHVHRAMLENARQGFWNGSRPPYGYGVEIAERRGNKDKQVLVLDEAEARVVRIIFDMASSTAGRRNGWRHASSTRRLYSRVSLAAATVARPSFRTPERAGSTAIAAPQPASRKAARLQGLRMPMDKLDDTVFREVSTQILQPDHLVALLDEQLRTAIEREVRNRDRLRQMRQDHKETEAGIARLLGLVEKGLMDAEDTSMRERAAGQPRFRNDELADQLFDLNRGLAIAEPTITPEKIERLQLLVNKVRVDDREIHISGSKAVLARSAAGGLVTPPAVLSFVREWRTRQACNNCGILNTYPV